jgi:4-diphosphocytidyl-2-C-methyl-D-erythritol kinase
MVRAHAKVNLDLRVFGTRPDGFHELRTVFQSIELHDTLLCVERPGPFAIKSRAASVPRDNSNLVWKAGAALWKALGRAGDPADTLVTIEKNIPMEAGLGGGSADAAAALNLANATLPEPLDADALRAVAAGIGADVPFFLSPGPKLAAGVGDRLSAVELPQDYWVVVAVPRGARKRGTGDVYRRFDELSGGDGFAERKAALLEALAACRRPRDFAAFPPNDLAPASAGGARAVADLRSHGAFRADVTGSGPAVYGLFHRREHAVAAAKRLRLRARVWVTAPVW